MGEFKIKQHVVPDFIIKRFSDEQGQVVAFNKKANPVKRFKKAHDEILVKNHANELKNLDGTFFHRNEIEDKFANIETISSTRLNKLYKDVVETDELSVSEISACIILLATQLIRSQKIKRAIIGEHHNSKEDAIAKGALYQLAVSSRKNCIEYLLTNGCDVTQEDIAKFNELTLLEEAAQFIAYNCAVFIFKTDNEHPFILTDSPVLIDKFVSAKYIFPISPTIAIGCSLFSEASMSMLLGKFIKLPANIIKKINQYLCDEAEQTVVCQTSIADEIHTYLLGEELPNDET